MLVGTNLHYKFGANLASKLNKIEETAPSNVAIWYKFSE